MKKYYCKINIPSEEVKKYYLGQGFRTRVTDVNGISIDLPTSLLIPHMTEFGIRGDFCITHDGRESKVTRDI